GGLPGFRLRHRVPGPGGVQDHRAVDARPARGGVDAISSKRPRSEPPLAGRLLPSGRRLRHLPPGRTTVSVARLGPDRPARDDRRVPRARVASHRAFRREGLIASLAMLPWSVEIAGRMDEGTIESEALKGNPLSDPHLRPIW